MRYFLPYLLVASPVAGVLLGGYWIVALPLALYAVLVLADLVAGEVNSPKRTSPHWMNAVSTWLWPPVQFALLAWVLWEIHLGRLTLAGTLAMGFAVGLVTGAIGITCAHELIHRRGSWERFLGQALLVSVLYHHFYIEHVFGHHRRAGTPHDPVTARRGESLYDFIPRALGGSFVSAWAIEATRLKRADRSAWSPRNRVVAGALTELSLLAAIALFLGWLPILFFVVQSTVAVLLLETINYIEHYGLARRETAPGVFERYGPEHAWDSRFRLSNWLLFNLPKHASHHLHPGRRHDTLAFEPGAPRLPVGYPLAIALALVPPLWFRVIHRHLPAARPKPA